MSVMCKGLVMTNVVVPSEYIFWKQVFSVNNQHCQQFEAMNTVSICYKPDISNVLLLPLATTPKNKKEKKIKNEQTSEIKSFIIKLCRNQFSSLRTYMEAVLWTNNTFNLPFQNANFVMVIL